MKKSGTVVRVLLCLALILSVAAASGCSLLSEEMIKLRDLDFTVLSDEKIPEQLKELLEEKKTAPFQITYTDNQNLYICVGYGKQETGGYSIAVNELYLTDNNVCVSTSLLGPDPSEKNNKTPSYPFIVIKTEHMDETVIFK